MDSAGYATPKPAANAVPARILRPAVHWSISADDLAHVHAQNTQQLYYADNGEANVGKQHYFGTTAVGYTIPAVNLDHSEFLSLDKAHGQAVIKFNSSASFDAAYQSWRSDRLLLLTYSPICPAYDKHEFCYVVISKLHFDNATSSVTATAKTVEPADFITDVSFEWGVHTPQPLQASDSGLQKRDSTFATCNGGNDTFHLPTAELGPDFDKTLDECRGYKEASEFPWSYYAKIIGANQETKSVLRPIPKAGSSSSLISHAARDSLARSSTHLSTAGILQKRDWLDWVPGKIPGLNAPLTKDFRKEISFSVPQEKAMDASPWGQARLLKRFTKQKKTEGGASIDGSLSLWCVDCGTKGSITLFGKATWSVQSGLTEGYVTASTNLNIGFALGMDIQAVLQASDTKQLVPLGLPGLSFGVVTLGPKLSVSVDYSFAARAEGRLLVGAKFTLQNANVRLDFVQPKNSGSTGWTPQFVPMFEAAGRLSVAAEIGLPLAVAVGIDILNGKYKKEVAFAERPALSASAQFAASTNPNECNGVSAGLDLKYSLYADIIGSRYGLIDPYTRSLSRSCIAPAPISGPIGAGPTIPPITASAYAGFNTTGPDTTRYTELLDATQQFLLTACPDSNLYLQPRGQVLAVSAAACAAVFQLRFGNVVADGNARLLHYYPDAMGATGVSRLRAHAKDRMPAGAEFVTFVPSNTGDLGGRVGGGKDGGKTLLMARDSGTSAGRFQRFYPALCTYGAKGGSPKVFLVRDAEKGLAMLEGPELQRSVTGGKVEKCYLLPLMVPAEERK